MLPQPADAVLSDGTKADGKVHYVAGETGIRVSWFSQKGWLWKPTSNSTPATCTSSYPDGRRPQLKGVQGANQDGEGATQKDLSLSPGQYAVVFLGSEGPANCFSSGSGFPAYVVTVHLGYTAVFELPGGELSITPSPSSDSVKRNGDTLPLRCYVKNSEGLDIWPYLDSYPNIVPLPVGAYAYQCGPSPAGPISKSGSFSITRGRKTQFIFPPL
jgi:hypothetical protein